MLELWHVHFEHLGDVVRELLLLCHNLKGHLVLPVREPLEGTLQRRNDPFAEALLCVSKQRSFHLLDSPQSA